MARQNLTDKTLKALKPAPAGGRYEIFDVTVPNMGIRVTDKIADRKTGRGRASFFLLARFPPSTNPTRRALGEYPAMELAGARNKAREWLALLEKGIDPKRQIEDEDGCAKQREPGSGIVPSRRSSLGTSRHAAVTAFARLTTMSAISIASACPPGKARMSPTSRCPTS